MSIEDIILSHDRRGISELRSRLPVGFCGDAAALILGAARQSRRTAIITTGFYVPSARAPETDGPPGALALGECLDRLGFDTTYVTDEHTVPLLSCVAMQKDRVIVFPIADRGSSERFASQVLADIQPSLIISVETCGANSSGQYLNMAGEDITPYTARIDCLFIGQRNTIGIGDGGNEIGMGNLARYIPSIRSLPQDPALTPVDRLVIASVSNWGGYGLIAALSKLVKQNLLPSVEWEKELIIEMVRKGAVDGMSGQRELAVDGFDTKQNSWALEQLHKTVARQHEA